MAQGGGIKYSIIILAVLLLIIGFFYFRAPFLYKYYELKLASADDTAIEEISSEIAAQGRQAIPRIRKWLKAEGDNFVICACRAVEKIKDDSWRELLPEISEVLTQLPQHLT